MERISQTTDHVRGLDSIRFVCAIWVFFGHGAAPPLTNGLDRSSHFQLILRGLYGNLWTGPSAVIIFFVVSGFCIHYPFAGTAKRPHLAEFYSRRLLRLLIPAAIAVPLSSAIGIDLPIFQLSVLWSLVAELIYYFVYPALRFANLRLRSWTPLIIGAYAAAIAVTLTEPRAGNYPSYGVYLNWVLGLPCWLLGCALAEHVRQRTEMRVSSTTIWSWRAGVLACAWLCSVLRFHSPIGYPWTLNFFALFVVCWLSREIVYRQTFRPAPWLEWAGLWSYSLYLLHPAADKLLGNLFPHIQNEWLHWFLHCCLVLTACYAFYLVVERPSHFIARRVSKAFRPTIPLDSVPAEA